MTINGKLRKKDDQSSSKKISEISNPIDEIALSDKDIRKAIASATLDSFVSSLKIVAIGKIYEWSKNFDQATKEKKLEILLADYKSHFDSNDEAIRNLMLIINTRGGQTLFSKIVQMTDKSSTDDEWIGLLAKILKNICDEDVKEFFEGKTYLLDQIDRLSTPAVIILSKYETWKMVSIHSTTTVSGQTTGTWIKQVTSFFANKNGIVDEKTHKRIAHAFQELESLGMIELHSQNLRPTGMGSDIIQILL